MFFIVNYMTIQFIVFKFKASILRSQLLPFIFMTLGLRHDAGGEGEMVTKRLIQRGLLFPALPLFFPVYPFTVNS